LHHLVAGHPHSAQAPACGRKRLQRRCRGCGDSQADSGERDVGGISDDGLSEILVLLLFVCRRVEKEFKQSFGGRKESD
jgi:hypothetical protein